MQALRAIIVGENGDLRAKIADELFGPDRRLVHAGTFTCDGEVIAWAQAGGRADVIVRTAPAVPSSPEQRLTAREREVVTLLAKGLSYAEIGRILGGLGTVQSHNQAHLHQARRQHEGGSGVGGCPSRAGLILHSR